jgi:putative toxin-antitoxin system antitoxin component (TIGR02293 family)
VDRNAHEAVRGVVAAARFLGLRPWAGCPILKGMLPPTRTAVSKSRVAEAVGDAQPELVARVQAMLGVARVRTDQDLVELVEARLATSALDGLRRAGLTDEELWTLIVPRRTLTHRRARGEALTRDESDRVVRVARIAVLAEHVFGERDRAWRWLRAGKRHLQGRSPLDWLVTEAGARLVEEQLYRIDEGMAA